MAIFCSTAYFEHRMLKGRRLGIMKPSEVTGQWCSGKRRVGSPRLAASPLKQVGRRAEEPESPLRV